MEGNAYNDILPTSTELDRSSEYGNEEIYALHNLKDLHSVWLEQSTDTNRSIRSRKEAEKIVGRLAFEIAYRTDKDMLLMNFEDEIDITNEKELESHG